MQGMVLRRPHCVVSVNLQGILSQLTTGYQSTIFLYHSSCFFSEQNACRSKA